MSNEAIQFVSSDQTSGQERSCPVCGEVVGPAPTTCKICDTPHHFDCWEYNAGCGVYGCSSRPAEPRKAPSENSVDLPAKLGMPYKRTGSYAGVWWVPPLAGAATIAFELAGILLLNAGSGFLGAACIAGMCLSILWIAFTSVHYYVDFETLKVTKAKSLLGQDLLEWEIADLDQISHLEVERMTPETHPGSIPQGASRGDSRTFYRILAVYKNPGFQKGIEIAPPVPPESPVLAEVADLFRRIEASGAFQVKMPQFVRRLLPPTVNTLLLEAQKKD